jgi:uncharacterized protein
MIKHAPGRGRHSQAPIPTLKHLASALAFALSASIGAARAQVIPKFKVLGFSTSKDDAGHIVYEREANQWLPKVAKQYGFQYDSTKVWSDCNTAKLSQYQVVIFMDERPEDPAQREAFRKYMDNGGGWIGCHGSGFAMTGSGQPMNWDWYHNTLLGSGEYRSNTWRPTSAYLKREDSTHALMAGMPPLFKSQPNEWYRWRVDLKTKPDIRILLSIDPSSFPLGTGPKPEEIWYSGYYPVAWTNTKYKMLYVNMGHNDINTPGTNKDSETFASEIQNRLFINALLTFGGVPPTSAAPAPASVKAQARAAAPGLRLEGSRMTASKGADPESKPQRFEMQGREIAPEKARAE